MCRYLCYQSLDQYGTLTLTAGKIDGKGSKGNWTYTLDNKNVAVQNLNTGKQLTDKITLTAADNTSTQQVNIIITGITDVPNNPLEDRDAGIGLDRKSDIKLVYGRVDYYKINDSDPLANKVVLTYNQSLDDDSARLPAATVFELTSTSPNGSTKTISPTGIEIKNNQVILTLSPSDLLTDQDKVNVSYKDPTINNDVKAIQDTAGKDTQTLTMNLINNLLSFIDTEANDAFSEKKSSFINPFGGQITDTTYAIYTKTEMGTVQYTNKVKTDYGIFSIDRKTGDYRFAPDAKKINQLSTGAEIVIPFEIHAKNGTITQPIQTYILITGTDDKVGLSLPKSQQFEITEGQTSPLKGKLSMTNTDASSPSSASLTTTKPAQYGTFTLNGTTGWTYSLDNSNPDVRRLTLLDKPLTDQIIVTTADGSSVALEIVIKGKNEPGKVSGDLKASMTKADDISSGNLILTDLDGSAVMV